MSLKRITSAVIWLTEQPLVVDLLTRYGPILQVGWLLLCMPFDILRNELRSSRMPLVIR